MEHCYQPKSRTLLIVVLAVALLAIISSAFSKGSPRPVVPKAPPIAKLGSPDWTRTNFVAGTGVYAQRIAKVSVGVEKVINSAEFRDRVVNFTWKGAKQFNENEGKTNEQIYDIIRRANEVGSGDDYTMSAYIWFVKKDWFCFIDEVAASDWQNYDITFNTCVFGGMKDEEVANTLVHETIHKYKFGHAKYYNDDRNFTVPYAVGRIVEELYPKYKEAP